MSNCFKRPESLLIAFKIAAVHQYKNGKKLVQSEASTNLFPSLSDMHLISHHTSEPRIYQFMLDEMI